MDTSKRRLSGLAVACITALGLGGCYGVYSNTENFISPPKVGQGEVEMLKKYGTPSLATVSEGKNVYFYKIRDTKYVLGFGFYDGHDLVVVCENGQIVETSKALRPDARSIFAPNPWAVAD